MPADKVEEMLELGREPVSLETPVGTGDEAAELADFIADDAARPPARGRRRAAARLRRPGASTPCRARERGVIELRYGLGDGGR